MSGNEIDFSGYGSQKSLQEILEELALYCSINGGGSNPKIAIVIPKPVQEAFTAEWSAKSKHNSLVPADELPKVRQVHLTSGIVEIFNSDEKKVVDK